MEKEPAIRCPEAHQARLPQAVERGPLQRDAQGRSKMIRIDRRSLRRTIRDARFPRDMNVSRIERDVERDLVEALRQQGVVSGTFEASLGDINYDIYVDNHGRRRIKRLRKR